MTRQQAAYLATALLFLSLFMPLINMPMMGAVTFVRFADGIPGIVMGLAVVVAAIASARRSYRLLLFPAVLATAALGFVIWQFLELKRGMAYTPSSTPSDDSFSRGLDALAQGMSESIQLQWGVGVALLATVMLFAIALSKRGSGQLPESASSPS